METMSQQKNKLVITVTLAVVSVFLLGGVSVTFFPSQATSTLQQTLSKIAVPSGSNALLFQPSANLPLTYWVIPANGTMGFDFYSLTPLKGVAIEADGSINSTAPIQRNGDTYTLTGDMTNQTIIINKDNILIDGVGHSLQFNGGNSEYGLEGFCLQDVQNVTIKNFQISQFWDGIWMQNCSNIIIRNNTLSNINTGIHVNSANGTTVTGNSFNNTTTAIGYSSWYGFGPSVNNLISENQVINAATGISLTSSYSNTVTDNALTNVYDPIEAGDNSTIAGNTMINGVDAIGVSSYDIVYGNIISNFSESGLMLGGVNGVIYQNTIANCSSAVLMDGSSDSYPFGNNTIYQNNFLNNTQPLLMMGNSSLSTNNWDRGKEGNYWSSYNGTGSANGIGDTPYNLGANNTDLYPLMQPYVQESAITDYSTGRLFFVLAIGVAVTGSAISLGLYLKFKVHPEHT